MLIYAKQTDLTAWTAPDPAPAVPASHFRFASSLVRRATLTARYGSDETGLPTDPKILNALRDATCAQVSAWDAAKIDPAQGAAQVAAAPVQSKKIGAAALTYDTSGAASVTALSARATAATSLCVEALLILADAGLVTANPGTSR